MDKSQQVQSRVKYIEKVNDFGDIICPHCSCRILTPKDFYLKSGSADCPLCGGKMILTHNMAIEANDNKDRYYLRTMLESLTIVSFHRAGLCP